MKKILVFYGYHEAWDKSNPWEQNLYDKNTLLSRLKDCIDDVILIKDMDALKIYLEEEGNKCKNYILPSIEDHVKELLINNVKSLFHIETNMFDKLINKRSFTNFLRERNLLHYCPRIYSKGCSLDSDDLVVVKQSISVASFGVNKKKIRDLEKWELEYCLIQEYIYGSEEFDAIFVLDKGEITLAFAYLTEFDKDEYIKFHEDAKLVSYKKVQVSKKIKKIIEEIMQPTSFTGACCFDFKIKDDKIRIFEINPRLDGSLTSPWNKDDLAEVIRHLIRNSEKN